MSNEVQDQEYKQILACYSRIQSRLRGRANREQKALVRKAFNLALNAHKNMRRRSGEPYIMHPLLVAIIVSEDMNLGATSVICALLHDTVEDTDYTLEDIETMFGNEVATIIDGLTKIEEVSDTHASLQFENFRKILLSMSKDPRVILIKLADRLHNMRTLDSMPLEKQQKIASETLFLYAPLAHRLGFYKIKSELEDLSMKYQDPGSYNYITQRIKATQEERDSFIAQFIQPIKEALEAKDMKFEIVGRTKSIYSIWQKMTKKQVPFEEVYDLFAIRIIIDVDEEHQKSACWGVYSTVTDIYKPNTDRLRDWISTPKANGYQALHTTVMSKTGRWVEVQIRSKKMDDIAENGFAAHWAYKQGENLSEKEKETKKKYKKRRRKNNLRPKHRSLACKHKSHSAKQ
jgi:GTP pyrophosphokinase